MATFDEPFTGKRYSSCKMATVFQPFTRVWWTAQLHTLRVRKKCLFKVHILRIAHYIVCMQFLLFPRFQWKWLPANCTIHVKESMQKEAHCNKYRAVSSNSLCSAKNLPLFLLPKNCLLLKQIFFRKNFVTSRGFVTYDVHFFTNIDRNII